MRSLLVILVVIVLGVATLAQDATPDSTATAPAEPTPDYLEQLKAFAEQYMEEPAASAGGAAPGQTVYHSGPVQQRDRIVWTDVELDGTVERDSVLSLKEVVRKVVIRDRDAIDYLFHLSAFQFSVPEDIEFMEIFDLSNSGFANGSVVKAHPSGESYILEGLGQEFVDAAAMWTRTEALQFDNSFVDNRDFPHLIAQLGPPDEYVWEIPEPNLPRDENIDMAINAIGGGVHNAVTDQYGLSPINLFFSRTDSTTVVEIWGYEPDSLRFRYLMDGDGIPRNDIMTVAVRDSFIKAFKSYVDVMVIRQERSDTLIAPPRRR